MGQQILTNITRFDGGISNDPRDGWSGAKTGFTTNKYSITKHFDALTYPRKLVPYNLTKNCDNLNKAQNIVKFVYGAGKLYGLGDQAGNVTKVQVYENDTLGGTDQFNTSTNGAGSTANKNTDVFFYYKTWIFMLINGAYLSRFHTDGSSYDDQYQSLSYTTTTIQAQPVHHKSDDSAYFFGDNKVYRYNGITAAWDGLVLTLPSGENIISACAYGDYLAIGTVTADTVNVRSTIYLWDRDSSLTTLTERIDLDEGQLIHLANLDNKLTAVLIFYTNSALGLRKGKVLVRQTGGVSATLSVTSSTLIRELNDDVGLYIPTATQFIRNNKLYFPMSISYNGDSRFGIWVVDSAGKMTLDTVEASAVLANNIQGIYATGNVWWIAYNGDGSVNRSSYTNADYSTTNSSTYETPIFNAGDSSLTKTPIGITVTYEPLLIVGAKVILSYRKDSETAWTQIFSHTNDVGSVQHSAVNIEGSNLPMPEFNEIQYQIESFGGAVITGLRFACEAKQNTSYQP